METPKSVLEIVAKAADKYPSDIPKALDVADKAVRKLPEFEELVSDLVRSAIQDLIYEHRHSVTRQIKRETGKYKVKPKVVVGKSKPVNEAALRSVYLMPIAGTVLGRVLGKDLLGIAKHEQDKANGSAVNARLCFRLDKLVPNTKYVDEVLSEKRLRTILQEVTKGK